PEADDGPPRHPRLRVLVRLEAPPRAPAVTPRVEAGRGQRVDEQSKPADSDGELVGGTGRVVDHPRILPSIGIFAARRRRRPRPPPCLAGGRGRFRGGRAPGGGARRRAAPPVYRGMSDGKPSTVKPGGAPGPGHGAASPSIAAPASPGRWGRPDVDAGDRPVAAPRRLGCEDCVRVVVHT